MERRRNLGKGLGVKRKKKKNWLNGVKKQALAIERTDRGIAAEEFGSEALQDYLTSDKSEIDHGKKSTTPANRNRG